MDDRGPLGRLTADRRIARLDITGVARFVIEDGARITAEPAPGTGQQELRVYLYGVVTALLLGQRGQFALHASTAQVGAVGLAVTGASGAGKSTTVLGLRRLGHRLVTDDISPVHLPAATGGSPKPAQSPLVLPFGRSIHVWPQTVAALGLDTTGGRPVQPGTAKLALAAPVGEPVPLGAVAELSRSRDATGVALVELTGVDALDVLLRNAYRYPLLRRLWPQELFGWATALSRLVPVRRIVRPDGEWTLDDVVDRLAHRTSGALRPTRTPESVGAAGRGA